MFPRAIENWCSQFDAQAASALWKIIFVWFTSGQKAKRSGPASVASVAEQGPVNSFEAASEFGVLVRMARHTKSRRIPSFFDSDR
jgi:hypothetical protein